MTREELIEIAENDIKSHPEMLIPTAKAIDMADKVVEMGLYSAEDAYEEVYKVMTREKARLIAKDIFKQAGMPL